MGIFRTFYDFDLKIKYEYYHSIFYLSRLKLVNFPKYFLIGEKCKKP